MPSVLPWPQVTQQILPNELIFQSLVEKIADVWWKTRAIPVLRWGLTECAAAWISEHTAGYHSADGGCPPDTNTQWILKLDQILLSAVPQKSYKSLRVLHAMLSSAVSPDVFIVTWLTPGRHNKNPRPPLCQQGGCVVVGCWEESCPEASGRQPGCWGFYLKSLLWSIINLFIYHIPVFWPSYSPLFETFKE